ncbi:type I-E CRISPR-associated protein Cas6/Cse3/CasE [Streptomyces sp. CAU 1734]|uniref:type I-E CRISPR-associated protein Cas6/Cse3/CasE n=1 Tax=Streptomyces sp. CAU 1734 TaxID=3140360 RepID=UPI0032612AB9
MTTSPAPAVFTAHRYALTLSPATRASCLDVHHLHQLVTTGLRPPHLTTAQPGPPAVRLLFAARRPTPARDPGTGHHIAAAPDTLLVQSPIPLDWQHLLDTRAVTRTEHQHVRTPLTAGDTVEIRLIANPSRRPRGTTGRATLTTAAECGAWLQRHLGPALAIAPHHIAVGPAQRLTGKNGILHLTCRELRAQGTLHDPAALHTALTSGIGPSKAYGCGLLLTRHTQTPEPGPQNPAEHAPRTPTTPT